MKTYGKRTWLIPDAYYPSTYTESRPNVARSHESVCVINTSGSTAKIKFTLLFEDRDPMDCFEAICGPGRANHVRMDKLVGINGEKVPQDTCYAILVESSTPIVAQYSRLDTTQPEYTLMTTIAYPVE